MRKSPVLVLIVGLVFVGIGLAYNAYNSLQLELTPILRSLPSREDAEAVEEAKRRAMAEARAMRAEGEVKEARRREQELVEAERRLRERPLQGDKDARIAAIEKNDEQQLYDRLTASMRVHVRERCSRARAYCGENGRQYRPRRDR